ncbi:MAG TPA: agmatinase [Syntrophales bacterium]|nr:agmatinase [Syntrophales bacterium]
MNFGGIEEQYTVWKKAAFVVVPVPYDLTTTYQSGSRRGPAAILDASGNMELYDEELDQETYLAGICTFAPIEAEAAGPEAMVRKVEERVTAASQGGKIPVVLGGEHSISLGAIRALKRRHANLSVLQFDAHADMRESYQGSPYSHACIARRAREICPVVQVGIRSLSAEEAVFLKANPVKTWSVESIRSQPDCPEALCRDLSDDVYVTIDLDVFDPSLMPSTGTPEPGGLLWHEVLSVLREVCRRRRVRGFDVVELAPLPGIVAPDFLAAKLTYRTMGYLVQAAGRGKDRRPRAAARR